MADFSFLGELSL